MREDEFHLRKIQVFSNGKCPSRVLAAPSSRPKVFFSFHQFHLFKFLDSINKAFLKKKKKKNKKKKN